MSRVDVSEVIFDDAFADTVIVQRRSRSIVDGESVPVNVGNPIKVTACVQPANSETLQLLPEGVLLDDAIRVWTRFELQAVRDGEGVSDEVTYRGRAYEVSALTSDYKSFGHSRAVCTLKRQDVQQ